MGICKLFIILLLCATPAWAQENMTMRQAVETGLRQNPSLAAVREALLGADYGIKSSQAAFGPSMTAGYGYTRLDEHPLSGGRPYGSLDNWALSLNINQPLFTGFNLLTTYQKSVLQKEQIASQLDQAELKLVLAIQQSFLGLMQARENVKSAEDSCTRLKSHLKVNTAFYEVGLRPKLDVLQAEVNVAKAEQALVTARNAVETQAAQLNTLLGKKVGDAVDYRGELEYRPITLALEECLEKAAAARPDLVIGQRAVRLADKDVTLAEASFYPQVAADFDYTRAGSDPMVNGGDEHMPSDWSAQVGMKWKFFESGKAYYGKRQAEKNVSRLEQEYLELQNQAQFEVKQNYLLIREAEKRIVSAKQALAAAKESFRMASARYEAQVGTNTDVLDAVASQTESEASLTSAMADYEAAVAKLYSAMGQKNPELLPQ